MVFFIHVQEQPLQCCTRLSVRPRRSQDNHSWTPAALRHTNPALGTSLRKFTSVLWYSHNYNEPNRNSNAHLFRTIKFKGLLERSKSETSNICGYWSDEKVQIQVQISISFATNFQMLFVITTDHNCRSLQRAPLRLMGAGSDGQFRNTEVSGWQYQWVWAWSFLVCPSSVDTGHWAQYIRL